MTHKSTHFFTNLSWATSALCLMLATSTQAADRFANVEISAEAIADGVYMFKGAGGNSVAYVGPGCTLMIDSQYAPLSDTIATALAHLGGDRRCLVLYTHYHGDHTGGNSESSRTGDTMVWFKGANVLHMGDQLFNGAFPYIDLGGGGIADDYIQNLRTVIGDMPADITIIPGHGPLANIAALAEYSRVIEETRQITVSSLNAGKSNVEIAGDLSAFADWGQGFISTGKWISSIKTDHAQPSSL